MRRHFNAPERAALYLAAGGCCEMCGTELQTGWHADHITPYSTGGPTDVTNGQALCPRCNLKKGSTMPLSPRAWQARFIAKYHAHTGPDFLCVACPAAGKTIGAGFVTADLLRTGEVERVLIVVPSDALRSQWVKDFAKLGIVIDGDTMNDDTRNRPQSTWRGEREFQDRQPVQGWVITYHSLAANSTYHRVMNNRKRTLVILDEVHHLGDESIWGKAAEEALSVCVRRLSLSGTPFRSDKTKMPFITYYPPGHKHAGYARFTDDSELGPFPAGFDYSYGKALLDKPAPVRPAVFEVFDGDVAWFDGKDLKDRKVRISDSEMGKRVRRTARRMVLDPAGQWLAEALSAADQRLAAVQAEGDPSAKGLVVCLDTEHAHAVADILADVTGVPRVPVAASKDRNGNDSSAQAGKIIENFGESRDRWLIAVQMVSEGVDIPQLRVGVYATNKRTELFFRQALGRFVRLRSDLPDDVDQTAHLFVPKEEDILTLADAVRREIGDGMLALLDSVDDETGPICGGGPGGGQGTLFSNQFQDSTGEHAGYLLPGEGTFGPEQVNRLSTESGREVAAVLDILKAQQRMGYGFSPGFAQSPDVPTQRGQSAPAEPWTVRAKTRRDALNKMVKQIAGRRLRNNPGSKFPTHIQDVWVEVRDRSGIGDLDRADIDELDRAISAVRDMWKSS